MLQSLPHPEPDTGVSRPDNPWAVVDLIVFVLFFALAFFALIVPFQGLPILYAIPLQGVFNGALVALIAGWIRVVRRGSFASYIHFYRSHTLSTRSLVILGIASALTVLFVSAFLPSTGPSPLEKLLNSRTAILMYGFFGVAVAPILEEVLFRGFLFTVFWEIGSSRTATAITSALLAFGGGLVAALSGFGNPYFIAAGIFIATFVLWIVAGPRLSLVITALLFALLHAGQLAGNVGYVILIFLVGFLLSLVRHRANSIVASFVVHTAYNGTLFALFLLSSIGQKFVKQ